MRRPVLRPHPPTVRPLTATRQAGVLATGAGADSRGSRTLMADQPRLPLGRLAQQALAGHPHPQSLAVGPPGQRGRRRAGQWWPPPPRRHARRLVAICCGRGRRSPPARLRPPLPWLGVGERGRRTCHARRASPTAQQLRRLDCRVDKRTLRGGPLRRQLRRAAAAAVPAPAPAPAPAASAVVSGPAAAAAAAAAAASTTIAVGAPPAKSLTCLLPRGGRGCRRLRTRCWTSPTPPRRPGSRSGAAEGCGVKQPAWPAAAWARTADPPSSRRSLRRSAWRAVGPFVRLCARDLEWTG